VQSIRKWSFGVHVAVGSAFLLLASMAAICATTIVGSRSDVEARAEDAALNLIDVIDRDIRRTFELLDLSLLGMEQVLDDPGFAELPPASKDLMLFDRSSFGSHVSKLLVTDSTGNVLYESNKSNTGRSNISDREFFRVHVEDSDVGLYVSEPFLSRDRSYWAVALSRRMSNADGSFRGTVIASIRLDYFTGLLTNLRLGPQGSIAIMTASGTLLMRSPYRLTLIGKKIANLADVPPGKPTTRVMNSPVDGVERRFMNARVTNLPFVINIGLATDDVFGSWRQRTLYISILIVVALMTTGLLSMMLLYELRRRRLAEADLRQVAERAELMARTDALTGVSNRRSLEQHLPVLWQDAVDGRCRLTCLMIDIDHFKQLNDVLGHAAGDAALQSIGGCLSDFLADRAGFVARYGGEEFLVLLTESDPEEAAQMLRSAIAAIALDHPGSPSGRVTVSIGIAQALPGIHRRPADMIMDADVALYFAKQAGRDCARHVLDTAGMQIREEEDCATDVGSGTRHAA
jgi:diguanylate cyclase (GGDEF)-like protein